MDVDLSTLNGANGFTINGIDVNDQSGFSVSGAGDVNGDGVDDFIIGAYYGRPNNLLNAGETYVVFGSPAGFGSTLNVSTLDGSNGFLIEGIDADDRSGRAVSGAGDVNGDGIADIIIGAYSADGYTGESYVVFGSTGGFASTLSLSALDGTNGFVINGIDADDLSGVSVAGAGDINGDGIADVIVGAYRGDGAGAARTGDVYVIFGKSSAFAASIDLSALDGTNGFRLDGIAADDNAGISVSGAGDVNGDGISDLVVGADAADPGGLGEAGETYVVFGSSGAFGASIDFSTLDGSNGFRILGPSESDAVGRSVSNAGDVNGDGIDDIIIGAPYANDSGMNGGASFVVFGSSAAFASALQLSAIDGTNGFRVNGAEDASLFGISVSAAGDVNGDGIDDIIVGAPYGSPNSTTYGGDAYVIFGSTGTFPAAINASALDGTNGFRLSGVEDDSRAGYSVSSAGDVNGDGVADLLVGADMATANGTASVGQSYIVFGTDAFAPELRAGQAFKTQENSAAGGRVGTIAAADAVGVTRFEVIGGSGQNLFAVDNAGNITLRGVGVSSAANDFETTPNAFLLTVRASDAAGNTSAAQSIRINITNDPSDDPINRAFPGGQTQALTPNRGTNGNDTLNGSAANELFFFAAGNDVGRGSGGRDMMFGSAGNDTLDGGDGADVLSGGNNDDRLLGRAGNDLLRGDAGNDALFGASGRDTLQGGVGNDRLVGGNDADNLVGDAGNDRLQGDAGNDVLNGGEGNDTLLGGANNDNMIAGGGDDFVLGGTGNDIAPGGTGDDSLFGGAGVDSLFGNDGNDRLFGQADRDILRGGAGNDVLSGGNGNDNVFGETGNDTLRGDAGDDLVVGAQGNDFVFSGTGNDTLDGGDGADRLFGDAGDDTIRLGNNDGDRDIVFVNSTTGNDRVAGFENGVDLINLQGSAIASAADLAAAVSGGATAVIDLGLGASITLFGVTPSEIDASDFVF